MQYEVVTELGLYRSHYLTLLGAEGCVLELLDHLAASEGPQVPSLALGGAHGILLGDGLELFPGLDSGEQLVCLCLVLDQYVGGVNFGNHGREAKVTTIKRFF